jgi:NADPH:quinone reductase-like Zn-dependent oxidoreductase
MLFDLAKLKAGQTVLVHGAGGNVGRFAVQFAKRAGATVIGTASARDLEEVRALGAAQALDYRGKPFEQIVRNVDVVIDLIGGDTRRRSWEVLKVGGTLVAASEELSEEDTQLASTKSVRAAFVEADVTANLLAQITELLDARQITTKVGGILPLAQTKRAHEMIEAHQQPSGKMVLKVR